jgi:2-iminobutanoate/2-iminopropanoate deaminase
LDDKLEACVTSATLPAMKKIISTNEAPAAVGPYSQAVRAGAMVFCAGQIPLDPKSGQIVSQDVAEQTRRVLDNLTAVLKSERLTLSDVVKTTVFVTDLADFQTINEIYAKYFSTQPPARSTVQVAALPKAARVEIEAIAVADDQARDDKTVSDTSG